MTDEEFDDFDDGPEPGPSVIDRLRDNWIAAALVAVILVGVLVFAFQLIPRDPGGDSAEAGFARDMSTHHGQAVAMALTMRDRTEDLQVFYLCTDIMLTQQNEIGMMTGWLMVWDLNTVGDDKPMAWMGMPMDGLMPGMATPEQIEQLTTLPVTDAEILFFQLMIRHHQGGIEMAQALLARSDNNLVRGVAQQMIVIQSAEIDTMNQMLEARGQSPITDPLPDSHEGM